MEIIVLLLLFGTITLIITGVVIMGVIAWAIGAILKSISEAQGDYVVSPLGYTFHVDEIKSYQDEFEVSWDEAMEIIDSDRQTWEILGCPWRFAGGGAQNPNRY